MMKKFELGIVKVSQAAKEILSNNGLDLAQYLVRHQSGEWGDAEKELHLRNNWALENHGIIRSVYQLPHDAALLISTNTDRSITWVMLETEYQSKEIGTQEGYALWAASYDHEINPLIAIEEPHVELILSSLAPTTALDAGTGTGRYARKLAQRGFTVSAVDQSPEMLKVAKRHAEEDQLKISFHHGTLEVLPFQANQFGLVVCGLVLCHLSDLAQTMREFSRVTKDSGYLLITDFHPGAVAEGWRTVSVQAEALYLLPNPNHSLDDYRDALEAAGYTILDRIDLYVREMPEETIPFHERWVQKQGDKVFGLILFAQKIVGANHVKSR